MVYHQIEPPFNNRAQRAATLSRTPQNGCALYPVRSRFKTQKCKAMGAELIFRPDVFSAARERFYGGAPADADTSVEQRVEETHEDGIHGLLIYRLASGHAKGPGEFLGNLKADGMGHGAAANIPLVGER